MSRQKVTRKKISSKRTTKKKKKKLVVKRTKKNVHDSIDFNDGYEKGHDAGRYTYLAAKHFIQDDWVKVIFKRFEDGKDLNGDVDKRIIMEVVESNIEELDKCTADWCFKNGLLKYILENSFDELNEGDTLVIECTGINEYEYTNKLGKKMTQEGPSWKVSRKATGTKTRKKTKKKTKKRK